MVYTAQPGQIRGKIRIPASKSHTIRALLIASFAQGRSVIYNPLHSDDADSCVLACRMLGATIDTSQPSWIVHGLNPQNFLASDVINTGNSGTTLYLTTSLAALGEHWTFFTGDHQIRKRPATNLLKALEGLSVQVIVAKNNGCAPYAVRGPWRGGRVSIECPTSQYLSSLLLAAPLAPSGTVTEIEVPLLYERPYAEMTLDWLAQQNIQLESKPDLSYFRINGGQIFTPFEKSVPADWSSATFFLVAACVSGGEVTLEGLDLADSQGDKAVLTMLQKMGANVKVETQHEGGQLITISARDGLHGAVLDLNETPDALPALAVAGCYAEGETHLVNVPQARLKETDRIAVMAHELASLGASIEEKPDGLVIRHSRLLGGEAESHHDHRVAMSLAIAALGSQKPIVINHAEAASVTFPEFFDLLEQLRQ
jgi:3-phosphoshikimate 1-carboxyvinyltransferase